jgi:circadian clock protein KaiB
MSDFLLKLYITGQTPRAEQAIANLRHMCDEALGDRYELVIIDVLHDPQLAEDEKILATPTLVREAPLPRRCIIGDLSDTERVLLLLGLNLYEHPEGDDA